MKTKTEKIVLTGGPCSGKTTIMAYLQEKLADYGVKAIVVPEAATEIINAGFMPGREGILNEDFQRVILQSILEKEERLINFSNLLKTDKQVILFDRGTMDGMAYMGEDGFNSMLKQTGFNVVELRDGRYDAVIHLRTTALGAEHFYTLSNNSARKETLEEARLLDEKTLQAWNGHPKLKIIDNSTDFEGKKRRVLKAICHILGMPVPIEVEKKFLVKSFDFKNFPVPCKTVSIEQNYLRLQAGEEGEEIRIRKRGQGNHWVYFLTQKTVCRGRSEARVEIERQISQSEYGSFFSLRDTRLKPIKKNRVCFVWKNQYFELDIFQDALVGLSLLEIELTEGQEIVSLPPFIEIKEEVTGQKNFSNYELARKSLA